MVELEETEIEAREKDLSGMVPSSVSAHSLPFHDWGKISSILCNSFPALTTQDDRARRPIFSFQWVSEDIEHWVSHCLQF